MFTCFSVLFDACVLYPAPVRDLILRLALADFYRAKWTDRIHDEWIFSLCSNRPDLNREKFEKMRTIINESIEDCLVEGYESLAATVPKNVFKHVYFSFRSLIDRPVDETSLPAVMFNLDRDGGSITTTVSRVLPGTVTDCSVSNRRWNLFKRMVFT